MERMLQGQYVWILRLIANFGSEVLMVHARPNVHSVRI